MTRLSLIASACIFVVTAFFSAVGHAATQEDADEAQSVALDQKDNATEWRMEAESMRDEGDALRAEALATRAQCVAAGATSEQLADADYDVLDGDGTRGSATSDYSKGAGHDALAQQWFALGQLDYNASNWGGAVNKFESSGGEYVNAAEDYETATTGYADAYALYDSANEAFSALLEILNGEE